MSTDQEPGKSEKNGELIPKESQPPWKCSLEKLPSPWTVGAPGYLQCEGSFVEKMKGDVFLKFKEKENKYKLYVLKPQSLDNQNVTLMVTSYKPGDHRNISFEVTDGEQSFQVEPMSWKVDSVLDPKKPTLPFGPMGPVYLAWPWWSWAILGVLVFAVLGFIFRRVKSDMERKALLRQLATHTTALSPYNQFSKDMRRIHHSCHGKSDQDVNEAGERISQFYVNQLDETLKLYLVRELKVPALTWGLRQVMAEIKKRERLLFNEVGDSLKTLLVELDQAKNQSEQIKMVDCDQLAQMCRTVAEKIYQIRRKRP